jgi:hypothetical protein
LGDGFHPNERLIASAAKCNKNGILLRVLLSLYSREAPLGLYGATKKSAISTETSLVFLIPELFLSGKSTMNHDERKADQENAVWGFYTSFIVLDALYSAGCA